MKIVLSSIAIVVQLRYTRSIDIEGECYEDKHIFSG